MYTQINTARDRCNSANSPFFVYLLQKLSLQLNFFVLSLLLEQHLNLNLSFNVSFVQRHKDS